MLRFDLCQSKQDARHHPADRPAQVDLLGHGDYAGSSLAPVGEQVHAVPLAARDPVQLPHHDRLAIGSAPARFIF